MKNNQITVLVVDSDENLCEQVRQYLANEGFNVLQAYDGKTAVQICRSGEPDIMVLDIMLPELDGWQVLTDVRQFSKIPIILISARGEVIDKVLGLELGADDYMTKPFEFKELVARVRARVRRSGLLEERDNETSEVVNLPNLSINRRDYSVYIFDRPVDMPPRELELLYFLASNPNKVFSRDQLLENVWGFDYSGNSRTVDVHIKRIREKLKAGSEFWTIKTVWAVGYKFQTMVKE